jgi:16S rRNA (guanine966-N2)-methyltransferase
VRIIAGEFRGRILASPPGDQTRPVTDRVKQSLFDIIAHRLPGATVYDCFAGPGSFGLESLSRGAVRVTFFESHPQTLKTLRGNIETLGVPGASSVVHTDLFSWMKRVEASPRADVVFLDPPYRYLMEQPDALVRLAEDLRDRHLSSDGLVVFRHDAKDRLDLPALPVADERSYGSMVVKLLSVSAGRRGAIE